DKHPVCVHARMPVETAEKSRMQRTRRRDGLRIGDDMVEFIRKLAFDIGKRKLRQFRRQLERQRATLGHYRPRKRLRPPRGWRACVRARQDAFCVSGSIWA